MNNTVLFWSRRYENIRTGKVFLIFLYSCAIALPTAITFLRLKSQWSIPFTYDAAGYLNFALHIDSSNVFSFGNREPGYIWLAWLAIKLGRLFAIGPENSMRLGNFFLYFILLFIFARFAKLFCKDFGAIAATAFLGLHSLVSGYAVTGLRDLPYTFFWVLCCRLSLRPPKTFLNDSAPLGLACGFLSLIRLNALFFFPWVIALGLGQTRRLGNALKTWLPALLISFLMVFPLFYLSTVQHGDLFYCLNVHSGFFSGLDGRFKPGMSFFHYYLQVLGIGEFIWRTLHGFYLAFVGYTIDCLRNFPLVAPLFLCAFLFVYAIGWIVTLYQKKWILIALPLLIVGPFLPLFSIGADPRLALSVFPFQALLLGVGVDSCCAFLRLDSRFTPR